MITREEFEDGLPDAELLPSEALEIPTGVGFDTDLVEAMEAAQDLGQVTRELLAQRKSAKPEEPRLCVTPEDRQLRLALIQERYSGEDVQQKIRLRRLARSCLREEPEKARTGRGRRAACLPRLGPDGTANIQGLPVGKRRACARILGISPKEVRDAIALGGVRVVKVVDDKGYRTVAYAIKDIQKRQTLALRPDENQESEIMKRRREWLPFLSGNQKP